MKPLVLPERHSGVSSKLKNYLIALLAASTTCIGLIAWHQSRQLDALRATLAASSSTPPTRGSSVAQTPPPPPASSPAVAAKPAGDVKLPEPPEEAPAGPSRNSRSGFAAMMANPDFAKAMNLQQRASLDARYAELFKQLKLPPETLERFKDLLVERQTSRMDVMMAARENGLNPRDNRDEIQKLVTQAQADVDANIKATLGDAAFSQYNTYETTQPQRTVVASLDQRLAYSGTPLTQVQSDFLVQALSGSASADTGGMPGPIGWSGGNRATITDDVIQRAQNVFSSDQITALKQLKAEQDAQNTMRDLMRNRGPR